jgi:hypothetical protein
VLQPGLPDFPWYNIPKWGKIHQTTTKYIPRSHHIPNNYKKYGMAVKFAKIFPSKAFPIINFYGIKIYHLAALATALR